ncbi:Isochorismatase hydrolase [Calocera viscosa TUFC12733]|uniref:Isochorismatase hydrolase n=1 Tax=Calocera viscosa (strain TUFC12733) TaxID=1330018 RepID=A0A167N7V4_CALVF|nr:Isochorismatase hydrolase [Calocera viscosa TUFC12733]
MDRNWGLDDTPLPAAMDRDFKLTGPPGGLGAELGNGLGRVLFKGERNTQMFPPLQEEYERNKEVDKWVDKDRMSGLWGRGGELERELESGGRRTLVVLGINADQCVSSTIVDAFALGYDVIALRDCIATTSPGEAKDQIMFNMLHEYGFVTDSEMVGRTSLA